MEFGIGPQFSREFSFEEASITNELRDSLNNWLSGKTYNSKIEKIYIGVICVSKGFDPFFMPRPLKIYRKEPAIEYEIKIDFEPFFKADAEEKLRILHHEFIIQSEKILNDKKMKNFDSEEFLNDLKKILKNH